MSVKINLYSTGEYKSNDGVNIIFELTNMSKNDILVLKWFTPLEGLRSSCLRVKVNGKIIPYDGIKVKRGTPTVGNFIRLRAGESASEKVKLDEAYDLPLRGNVLVEFEIEKLLVVKNEAIKNAASIHTEALKQRLKKVEMAGCQFKMRRTRKAVKSFGILMRTKKKSSRGIRGTPKDPNTEGMNEDEKKKMKAAHVKGHSMANDSLTGLADNAKYKKWFGAHTAARFTAVTNVYNKVTKGLEDKQFTYVNNGPSCEDGDIAYTSDGSAKIFICKAFWDLSATGENSKAGTVVHEHSHTSASTNDHTYGIDACIKLAKDDPNKAIDNGDNFEYYSET